MLVFTHCQFGHFGKLSQTQLILKVPRQQQKCFALQHEHNKYTNNYLIFWHFDLFFGTIVIFF